MNIFIVAAIVLAILILIPCIIYGGMELIWKIVQKYTPAEIVVGQATRIYKAKIPGFNQILFSYTRKGKPYEAVSRPIWHKKKFRWKGKYQIKVYHRKIQGGRTTVWADPISNHRVPKQKAR